ncbi:MAG: MBL fold metallo-hydrolase [Desulfurococcales archaeon]|nr:MBL fold metallo-hydrolase [Desulfurococcales archaeon]
MAGDSGCGWCSIARLSDHVVAVVDRDGGWFLSNSGIIDMGGYTLIVDTQYNPRRAADVAGIASSLGFPSDTIVLITHHHGDHAWGTHALRPAHVLMLESSWRAALEIAPAVPDMYKPFFPWLDFTGSKYSRPSILMGRDGCLLQGSNGVRVRIEAYGPAHTVGDAIAIVEDENIAFIGDLAFNRVTPYALDGTVKGWIAALEKLEERLAAHTVVPGHGAPGPAGEILGATRRYLEWVFNTARASLERGVRDPVAVAGEASIPGDYSVWRHPERLAFNLERAFMDLEGRPPGAVSERLPVLASLIRE